MPRPVVHISRFQTAEEQSAAEYAAWGRGTIPEFIVWKYLTKDKHQKEGVDFTFQSSMFGGRRIFGGEVLDFYIYVGNMGWRVQGEEFHLVNVKDRVHDKVIRLQMEARGMVVVDLWVRDLLSRPQYVLDLAWQGHEVEGPIDE
jgi:hypothetical protein